MLVMYSPASQVLVDEYVLSLSLSCTHTRQPMTILSLPFFLIR